MAEEPTLIIQVPRGSAIERQLRAAPPPAIRIHDVLIQSAATDDEGNLEALGGEVVLSVPAPSALARQADEVEHVLRRAGTGAAPLVVVIEAAEELENDQVAPIVEAAGRVSRPVVLRIIRPSER